MLIDERLLKQSPCGGIPRMTTYEKHAVDQYVWVCNIQCGVWQIQVQDNDKEEAERKAFTLWNDQPVATKLLEENIELKLHFEEFISDVEHFSRCASVVAGVQYSDDAEEAFDMYHDAKTIVEGKTRTYKEMLK